MLQNQLKAFSKRLQIDGMQTLKSESKFYKKIKSRHDGHAQHKFSLPLNRALTVVVS